MEADSGADLRARSEALLESPSTQFQVSSLPALTEFLDHQMVDINAYSLANNVGILKIYMLNPEVNDPLVIQKVLVQALTQLPAPDFTVCMAQIPVHVQSNEPVAKLINFHTLLQNCMFLRFWEAAKAPLESLVTKSILDVPGVCDSVRRFVLDILPLVYHQMSVPEVRSLLNFRSNSQEFEDTLSLCGWAFDSTYKREDHNSGLCYSLSREDSAKQQKGSTTQNALDKYLKSDPMKYYYATLHN